MAVFSSVLALGMSRTAIDSFLNVERSSRLLVQQLWVGTNNEVNGLVRLLEKTKYECAVWIHAGNAALLNDFKTTGELNASADYFSCTSLGSKTSGYFFRAEEANNAYTEFIQSYKQFRANAAASGGDDALSFVDAYVLPHKGLVAMENLSLAETLSVLTQLQVRLLMLQQTAKLP
jgi:hypothetical protein